METKIVGNETQARPYYSKAEAQMKAALIGITVIFYFFAIFGIWMLTRTPMQFRAQVLAGVFMSISLILTGACFYVFRKQAETTKTSLPAKQLHLTRAEVHVGDDVFPLKYDLDGTVDELRKKMVVATGKPAAIITADYEVLTENNVSLREQGVRKTSFFKIFETEKNFINVTLDGKKRKFQFRSEETVLDLKSTLSRRFLVPDDKITLWNGFGKEYSNFNKIKDLIRGDVEAEIAKSDGNFTIKYRSKTYVLSFYADETIGSLRSRILLLTGVQLNVSMFSELRDGAIVEIPDAI